MSQLELEPTDSDACRHSVGSRDESEHMVRTARTDIICG